MPATKLCVECKDALEKRPKGSQTEQKSESGARTLPPPLFSAESGGYVFETRLPSGFGSEDEMFVSIWTVEPPLNLVMFRFTHEEAHKLAEMLNKTANLLEQDEVDDDE